MNTLVMKFLTKAGKNCTIRVPNVKDDLTALEANSLMDLLISTNIFYTGDQELVSRESSELDSTKLLA
ncbi:MAG: DUF2922 domain-containing protein [Clostridiaceae bacterium]